LESQAEGKRGSPTGDFDGGDCGDEGCGGETGEGVLEDGHWIGPCEGEGGGSGRHDCLLIVVIWRAMVCSIMGTLVEGREWTICGREIWIGRKSCDSTFLSVGWPQSLIICGAQYSWKL